MSYLELLKEIERTRAEKAEKERKPSLREEAEERESAEKADYAEEALIHVTGGQSRYAFPWPDEIEGLGSRHIEAFTPCANCETGTWAFYGPWPLCLRCANLGRLR